MIKNIVFDVGNVLVHWKPREIVSRYTKDEKVMETLIDVIFNSEDWWKMDTGELSYFDGVKNFRSRVPDNLKGYVDEILEPSDWNEKYIFLTETEDLIDKLKNNGYKCYILSNISDVIGEAIRNSSPGKKMDGYIMSALERKVKPNRDIYELLFERYNLKPEECFFIDDRKNNIDAGIALGMHGFVFDYNDYDSLYKALRNEGITF